MLDRVHGVAISPRGLVGAGAGAGLGLITRPQRARGSTCRYATKVLAVAVRFEALYRRWASRKFDVDLWMPSIDGETIPITESAAASAYSLGMRID